MYSANCVQQTVFNKLCTTTEISLICALRACQHDVTSSHHSEASNDFVNAKAGPRMVNQEAGAVISLFRLLG